MGWQKLPLPGVAQQAAASAPEYSFGEDLGFFGKSAINSLPETIGLEGWIDPKGTEQWRDANPIASIASQGAGLLIPGLGEYAAGAKLLSAGARFGLPVLRTAGRAVEALDAMSKSRPILAPTLSDALKMVPGEAARLGVFAANNPEDFGAEALGSVIGNTALPLIGRAAWRGLGAFAPWKAPSQKLSEIMNDFPVKGALQEQIGHLYDNLPNVAPDAAPYVQAQINAMERQVLGQQARGAKYVGKLASGADSGDVNRLFQLKKDSGLSRKQFIVSPATGFDTRQASDEALAQLGLPEKAYNRLQFPRVVEALEKSNAKAVQKTITKNFTPAHNGWYISEEADTGLHVLAKKLSGDPTKSAKGDRWAILKTSDPNYLVGRDVITEAAGRLAKFATNQRAFREMKGLEAMPETSIARLAESARQTFSRAVGKGSKPGQILANIPGAAPLKSLGESLANMSGDQGRALQSAWEFTRDKISPAMAEFRGRPLAESARLITQSIKDAAEAKASGMLYGKQGLREGQNLYGRLVSSDTPKGLAGLVAGLHESDLPLITSVRNAQVPIEEVQNALATLGADPKQMERLTGFFRELQKADDALLGETQAAQRLYGESELKGTPGHYMLSHTWKGNWRQRVLDDRGNTIAIGAGANRKEAVANAEKLAADLGLRQDPKGPFISDFDTDAKLSKQVLKRTGSLLDRRARGLGVDPYTFRLRQGVKGFLGDQEPLTKRELLTQLESTVRTRYKYLAEQAVKHQVLPDMLEVWHRYGPKTFNALAYRINQQFGIKGPINKLINESVDKVLAPVLGKNSADRLVRAYNAAELQLTLLSYNLAHPIMNALTFMQTVLPKAAFVLGADNESLSKVMGYMPQIDPRSGKPKGIMGVFEPLKLATRSFRDMARPDDRLRKIFDRAASEGVITAGLQENYVGESSEAGKYIVDLAGSQDPIGKFLSKVSSSPFLNPARKSEELSRAHALVVGKNLGEVLGVKDPEALYQFAKQFTHRTMYQYTTADRPKVFNGPLGSLAGLFKNWAFHYLADMGLYAGEAAKRKQFAPLLWSLGGQGLLAGAGGMTAYGMADGLNRLVNDEPLMDTIYNSFDDKDSADVFYYGLPALFGTSLQANAAGPFANPLKDVAYLTNFAIVRRAQAIGSMLDYAGGQIGVGQNPLANPQFWDKFSYALAPRVLYKALGQIEDGALKAASNGQPIIDGLSQGDYLRNMFGLTPTEIAKAYELNEFLYSKKEAGQAMTAALGEAFFQAMQAGDQDAMQRVMQQTLMQGASLPNVLKSAQSRLRASLVPSLELSLAKDPEALVRSASIGLPAGQVQQ